jgi:putative flippase GtrA
MTEAESNAWWRLPQQVRFLAAGGFNTAVGYALFSVMFLLFGRWVHYLLIGLAAHMIAVVNAFVVHRKLVFRSTDDWWPAFVRFNVSQVVSLTFGMAALYSLVEFARWNPLLAQLAATVVSVVLNYLLHRYFSFRKRISGNMGTVR